jgi:cysteine desulfurase
MSYQVLEKLADNMSMSAGPACHDPKSAKSTTLSAMNRSQDVIAGTLRLSTGKSTTKEEILKAAELIANEYDLLPKRN